jgi:hypothetical protein
MVRHKEDQALSVFVCYRREDDQFLPGRLRDVLASHFGQRNVFYDIDGIPPGEDFRDVIRRRLKRVNAVLVLIGPAWNTERLSEPDDFVGVELQEALLHEKLLIPVLVGNAVMPAADRLPPELKSVAYLNATRVRPDPDFASDSARLIKAIERVREGDDDQPPPPPSGWWQRHRRVASGAATTLVLGALVIGLFLRVGADGDDGADAAEEGSVAVDTLAIGHYLDPGQSLESPNGRYRLEMQRDGNLVLHEPDEGFPWNSHTEGNPGARLVLQDDGNLVIYGVDGTALSQSETEGSLGARLVLQDDGNLVIYGVDGTAVWDRRTMQLSVPKAASEPDIKLPSPVPPGPGPTLTTPTTRTTTPLTVINLSGKREANCPKGSCVHIHAEGIGSAPIKQYHISRSDRPEQFVTCTVGVHDPPPVPGIGDLDCESGPTLDGYDYDPNALNSQQTYTVWVVDVNDTKSVYNQVEVPFP